METNSRIILVALSGGADSVFLLLHLIAEGYTIEAVHCNFHLRGDESDRDEQFCKNLCSRKGIKLHIAHFDTKEYAALHKVSIELAARRLRYAYFEQLREAVGADCIAVAHHKDDNVETILHNIIRGTGIKGLSGMQTRNGRIWRPLLNITRKEIEERLRALGETYITDSTNLLDDATRNKIRHHIVPVLKEINPQAVENISRMAAIAAETYSIEQHYYEELAQRMRSEEQGCECYSAETEGDISGFTEGFLHYLLADKGFNATQIANISAALRSPEAKMFLAKDRVVDVSRHRLYISERREDTFQPKRTPSGNLMRRPKPGDRFRPKGLKGTKLVSDYLNEKRLSPPQKRQVVVVENPAGEIIDIII
ncbi:MAG: tRNA lysidine(34) synthetase TilS [Bacteroidaceae bacterium]|nr:tRNA lysidine(34) synthetase TilS [Bacteroidaceae bacterium]